MRVFVASKLVQRNWQVLLGLILPLRSHSQGRPKRLNDGNKRQTVEIQVTHVGPDLQFQSAEVGPAAATPAEAKQSA